MSTAKKRFIEAANVIAFDEQHRKTIRFNIARYDAAVKKGKERYVNLELAKERASYIKQQTINKLDKYLMQFEAAAIARGSEVLWAEDGGEALRFVADILAENGASLLVKSKSMTTEEIDFNECLEEKGVKSVETDLGEYIVQLAGEKPYHIVTPCMHKSKEDIAKLFYEKFGTPEQSTPEYLTQYVRKQLRENFVQSDVGVTGANFLLADKGGVCLTENEGNAMMSFSMPKVHIVIAGIEKLIPRMQDLALFWPLLSAHGTGQQITVYNSIVLGPKTIEEPDGPDKMYIILLDNQRSKLYQKEEQYKALKCIRCGACLNACPVYKNIGGYTYDATYSGPIGSVISPFYKGFSEYNHLSSACSVCGKCTEVCPVKVPLHELLLLNRREAVQDAEGGRMWNMTMKGFEYTFSKRKRLDMFGGEAKSFWVGKMKNILGKDKEMPKFAKESFSKQWKKQQER